MAKHIELFENFVNELHSDTYYSAADKIGKYSKDKASDFRNMGDKRRAEEISAETSEKDSKFHALKSHYAANDPMKAEFEAWIASNLSCMDNNIGHTDHHTLKPIDIAIDWDKTVDGLSINGDFLPYFGDAVLKTEDGGYVDMATEIFPDGGVFMDKLLPRRLAKWVFANPNFPVNVQNEMEIEHGPKEDYEGPARTWRDLWDGQS